MYSAQSVMIVDILTHTPVTHAVIVIALMLIMAQGLLDTLSVSVTLAQKDRKKLV